jgi:putative redox protein
MADDSFRSIEIERTGTGHYTVRNARGATMTIGAGSSGTSDFTPVELLLAAIGGCTMIDVDLITGKRAEPTSFHVTVTGDKIRDDTGTNRMTNLAVTFTVSFPDGEAGDAARAMLPRAVQMSHDRLCTVSRTVELGSPVTTSLAAPRG